MYICCVWSDESKWSQNRSVFNVNSSTCCRFDLVAAAVVIVDGVYSFCTCMCVCTYRYCLFFCFILLLFFVVSVLLKVLWNECAFYSAVHFNVLFTHLMRIELEYRMRMSSNVHFIGSFFSLYFYLVLSLSILHNKR